MDTKEKQEKLLCLFLDNLNKVLEDEEFIPTKKDKDTWMSVLSVIEEVE